MKRAHKLLKIARDTYNDVDKKRKRTNACSPVPPFNFGLDREVTDLMKNLDENLNEKTSLDTLENKSSPDKEIIVREIIVSADIHEQPSILQDEVVPAQDVRGYTPIPPTDTTQTLQIVSEIIEVQEQSDEIELNQHDCLLMPSYDITTKNVLLSSPVIEIQNIQSSQPETSYQTDNISTTIEFDDLQLMSVATEDIVIDSPDSTFTIPSVVSSPQSGINSPVIQKKKRNSEKRKGPGKTRTINMNEWKDLKRKALKNSGKMYTSRKGINVSEKNIKPPCVCSKKCIEKVPETERRIIFKRYWNIADHERQWEFISKYVTEEAPKRIKSNGPNRSRTNTYRLPIGSSSMIVCRTMFLNTLAISEKVVRTVLKKQSNNKDTEVEEVNPFKMEDLRGRHKNRPHKLHDNIRESVKDHINSMVPIESHYCRKSSTKKYLDGHLSYTRIHLEYLKWFNEEKYGQKKATSRQYADIVNKYFNIGFHSPKKDQCDRCHSYSNIINPTEEQKQDQDKHLALKDLARKMKDADKTAAQNDPSITTACFDMQKVLNCPHGEVSIFYYKRRLNLHNLTVFDMAKKLGFCYMWDETTGKKGANEVCSSLQIFIRTELEQGTKEFRFWSDNCSGQNRNRIVFAFYQYVVSQSHVNSITHRFLEVGHTQNEGDSVHSVIEGASNRGRVIYTPDQWCTLIRWAKTTESAYRVKEMNQDEILDFRSLLDGRNWIKNDMGEKVVWNKIKEVCIKKESPDILLYKYELDSQEYSAITTSKKTRSKKTIIRSDIKKAYSSPLELNYDKYKDLLGMCESKIILEEHAHFFKSLPHREHNVINEEVSDDEGE